MPNAKKKFYFVEKTILQCDKIMYNICIVCDTDLGGDKVENLSALKYLVWVSALSASVITPIIICVLLGYYIKNKFSLGIWVIILFILLGFLAGILNLFKFFKFVQSQAQNKKQGGNNGRF